MCLNVFATIPPLTLMLFLQYTFHLYIYFNAYVPSFHMKRLGTIYQLSNPKISFEISNKDKVMWPKQALQTSMSIWPRRKRSPLFHKLSMRFLKFVYLWPIFQLLDLKISSSGGLEWKSLHKWKGKDTHMWVVVLVLKK
jgi:hypothetical protein